MSVPSALDAALQEFAAAQSAPPPGPDLGQVLAERQAANAAILNRFEEVQAQSHQEISALRAEVDERARADMEAERQARADQLRSRYQHVPASIVARLADDPNAENELAAMQQEIGAVQQRARTEHEAAMAAVRNTSFSGGRTAEFTPQELFALPDHEYDAYKRSLERGGR